MVEFKLPGETVLTRLIETLEKGVGSLAKPWTVRREGKANAEARRFEALLLAQTERDLEEVRTGRKTLDAGGKLAPAEPLPSKQIEPYFGDYRVLNQPEDVVRVLTNQAGSDERLVEVREGINLKRIALKAEEEAERRDNEAASEGRSDGPGIDLDWVLRWRREAKGISSEQMQQLWAALLVGEVETPGTYSARTIDLLSSLSQKDAELVVRIAPHVTQSFLFQEGGIPGGLKFDDLLYLQEIGIVGEISKAIGMRWDLGSCVFEGVEQGYLENSKQSILVTKSSKEAKLNIPITTITKRGQEIMALSGLNPEPDALIKIGQYLLKNGASRVRIGPPLRGGMVASMVTFVDIPQSG